MVTQTATIPRKISGGDELVVIKKRDFDLFRRWQTNAVLNRDFVDKRLEKALADVRARRVSKPYKSTKAFVRSLKSHAR